ncbi:hypothetical protein FACS1894133_0680 [Clostridia bacterium]|nr:hypothetical protein FACS1894133_0110 [Clostridia bacterium]GHU57560.1 hypothetical protein FACS1894133_0680 [Clostridia bacterium]
MTRLLILRKGALALASFMLVLSVLTACTPPPPPANPDVTSASQLYDSSAAVSPAPVNQDGDSVKTLYDNAVRDAVFADDSEILPLVSLTPDDPLTTWNDKGQVLLLTFHKYPESYVAGADYTTEYGEVWTFTDKEIAKWYRENKEGVTDWTARFKQVIGVPFDKEYTHFSAVWVTPSDVKRPAYETDVTKQLSGAKLPEDVDPAFKTWFEGNIIWSYFDSWYPWTRLGYTYDWGNPGKEYGLSEFLIRKDATVTVEFTKTTDEFLSWLNEQ